MTEHTIQPLYWTSIAATSYECVGCGETATTPRGFSGQCDIADEVERRLGR